MGFGLGHRFMIERDTIIPNGARTIVATIGVVGPERWSLTANANGIFPKKVISFSGES